MKLFCFMWVLLFLGLVPVAMWWDKKLKAQRRLRKIVKTFIAFRSGMIDLNKAAISAGKSMREFMATFKGMNS